MQQILSLRERLHQYGHEYYVLAAPTISDSEYDQLFRTLQNLEALHPELKDPNSPTARVGARTPNRFAKVKHAIPMLSLENSFTAADLRKWTASVEALCTCQSATNA
jgi:DNA ligase (NAD+)